MCDRTHLLTLLPLSIDQARLASGSQGDRPVVSASIDSNHAGQQHHHQQQHMPFRDRAPGGTAVPKPIEYSASDYLNAFGTFDFAALLTAVASAGSSGGGIGQTRLLSLLDEDPSIRPPILSPGLSAGLQQQGDCCRQEARNALASRGEAAPLVVQEETMHEQQPSNLNQLQPLDPPSLLLPHLSVTDPINHQQTAQGQLAAPGSSEASLKPDDEEGRHHHRQLYRPNFKPTPLVSNCISWTTGINKFINQQ